MFTLFKFALCSILSTFPLVLPNCIFPCDNYSSMAKRLLREYLARRFIRRLPYPTNLRDSYIMRGALYKPVS